MKIKNYLIKKLWNINKYKYKNMNIKEKHCIIKKVMATKNKEWTNKQINTM